MCEWFIYKYTRSKTLVLFTPITDFGTDGTKYIWEINIPKLAHICSIRGEVTTCNNWKYKVNLIRNGNICTIDSVGMCSRLEPLISKPPRRWDTKKIISFSTRKSLSCKLIFQLIHTIYEIFSKGEKYSVGIWHSG